MARRLEEGVPIESPEVMRYVYGVARNVLLEYWKSQGRETTLMAAAAPTEDAADAEVLRQRSESELDCFAECLSQQPEPMRDLLLRYYEHTGSKKIQARFQIAKQLGIPANALRIRIHRVKANLQRCIDRCVRRKKL